MPRDKSLSQLWEDQQCRMDQYQQPKWLWLWTAIGSALLTVALGFASGAWTTRWHAEKMAAEAARAARVELVANTCAAGFVTSGNHEARLSTLMQASALERSAMLQDEGWVTLAGMEKPLAAAAQLCADKLADTQAPATNPMLRPEGSKS